MKTRRSGWRCTRGANTWCARSGGRWGCFERGEAASDGADEGASSSGAREARVDDRVVRERVGTAESRARDAG